MSKVNVLQQSGSSKYVNLSSLPAISDAEPYRLIIPPKADFQRNGDIVRIENELFLYLNNTYVPVINSSNDGIKQPIKFTGIISIDKKNISCGSTLPLIIKDGKRTLNDNEGLIIDTYNIEPKYDTKCITNVSVNLISNSNSTRSCFISFEVSNNKLYIKISGDIYEDIIYGCTIEYLK